jgi:hypothetical protein
MTAPETVVRIGWWARALAWLRERFMPVEPAPAPQPVGALTLRRRMPEPVVVPAKGYVFDFQLHAIFTWISDGLPFDQLDACSHQFMPRARQALSRLASQTAGDLPPHRARDLEVALNRAFDGKSWHYRRGDATVRCRAEVWVRLDDRVKEYLQPSWEKQIKMEADHEVNLRRAELVDQLSRRWLSILDNLRGSPAAPSAAQLTDKEFAEEMRKLAGEQRDAVDRLLSMMEETLQNGRSGGGLGEYEVAEGFDLLNQALRRQAGLGPPRAGNGGQPV